MSKSPAGEGFPSAVDLPAPPRWRKTFIPNKGSKKFGPRQGKVIFTSPDGDYIKNKKQLYCYLKEHAGRHLSLSDFDWGTGETRRRSERINEKASASDVLQQPSPARSSTKTKASKRKEHQIPAKRLRKSDTSEIEDEPPAKRLRKLQPAMTDIPEVIHIDDVEMVDVDEESGVNEAPPIHVIEKEAQSVQVNGNNLTSLASEVGKMQTGIVNGNKLTCTKDVKCEDNEVESFMRNEVGDLSFEMQINNPKGDVPRWTEDVKCEDAVENSSIVNNEVVKHSFDNVDSIETKDANAKTKDADAVTGVEEARLAQVDCNEPTSTEDAICLKVEKDSSLVSDEVGKPSFEVQNGNVEELKTTETNVIEVAEENNEADQITMMVKTDALIGDPEVVESESAGLKEGEQMEASDADGI